MFANWFGIRKRYQPEQPRFFRPTLEVLESRLAPSGMMPGMGGPPGGPPGHVNVHINAHDSFNTTITDSFNTAVNNVTVNQTFTTANNPQLQQTFQTNLILSAQLNLSATIGLVVDEVHLAADTYFSLVGGVNNPGLAADMHNFQLAIQQNPLEATPPGEALGYQAFNLALITIAQGQQGQGQS